MELHLKVSELEEENLLLKQKLKETELENEKIQVILYDLKVSSIFLN